jgi:hypothetical protein
MKCPDDVQEILGQVLTTSLLRIRAAGWNGDAELCAIEADHVHNLSTLLSSFSVELLHFYLDVERVAYLENIRAHAGKSGAAADIRAFEDAWKALESLLPSLDIMHDPSRRQPVWRSGRTA